MSGLLNLNQEGRISYMELFLKKEINFADPISVKDYITQKDSFCLKIDSEMVIWILEKKELYLDLWSII